jgi:2-polyprenyl-6-methoxyphenol hydroxylase-like FAD-dependent oxidoreductase
VNSVVICGAGIAGLALAERLARQDWDVVLLDKSPGPRTQGYMMDFFGVGYRAAEQMGVLARLRELGYVVHEIRFHDGTGRVRARMNYERISQALDGRVFGIMRPDLEAALREALPQRVEQRFGVSVAHVDYVGDEVRVALTDGQMLRADLLVGADGIHSAVRNLVFGAERDHLRHLGFHTAAFTFTDPAVHAEVAHAVGMTDSVDRQVGMYGLRDGRVAAFTVHRTAGPALPANPASVVRAEYASLGWVVPRALAHCPEHDGLFYDQVAQIVMPSWSRGRVVVTGDAGHAVSLLAGQGASLAVGGAFVLARCLRDAGSVQEGLAAYERTWRPIIEEKQRVALNAARWFLPHTATQLRVRRVALGLSHLPGVSRFVAKAVIGKPSALIAETGEKAS